MLPKRALSFALWLACAIGVEATVWADGNLRTIALTGDQVPNAEPGVMFDFFDPPVLNAGGQAAFFGSLSGTNVNASNNGGIYSESGSSLAQVVREGDRPPNTAPGVVFDFFGSSFFADTGQSVFGGFLEGPGVDSTNDLGIYRGANDNLVEVARDGGQAPGSSAGVVFDGFDAPVINATGQLAFRAPLRGTGVTPANDSGIFQESVGVLGEVVRKGDQAPNALPGVVFNDFPFLGIVLNQSGQIALRAELSGPGVGFANDSGIYNSNGGLLTEVAREGNQAPNAVPGVVFGSFPSSPVIDGMGNIAFFSSLAGVGVDETNNAAIYFERDGALTEVAREGNQAPNANPGVVFSSLLLDSPAINAEGQLAFGSILSGTGVDGTNDSAIYTDKDGTLSEVAREGDQAPGGEPGIFFSNLFSNAPVINAEGQTAFAGLVNGPGINSSNNEGIYATDINGQLVRIAHEGDLIDVNDDPLAEDLRAISSLDLLTDIDARRASVFNDFGQLAFRAIFTDGTSGIFVSNRVANLATVPEPTSMIMLLIVSSTVALSARFGRERNSPHEQDVVVR